MEHKLKSIIRWLSLDLALMVPMHHYHQPPTSIGQREPVLRNDPMQVVKIITHKFEKCRTQTRKTKLRLQNLTISANIQKPTPLSPPPPKKKNMRLTMRLAMCLAKIQPQTDQQLTPRGAGPCSPWINSGAAHRRVPGRRKGFSVKSISVKNNTKQKNMIVLYIICLSILNLNNIVNLKSIFYNLPKATVGRNKKWTQHSPGLPWWRLRR